MKMIYKIKKYFVITLLSCFFVTSSCSDWLDLMPTEGVVENDYWQTKEDVFAVLMGCYSSLLNNNLVSNMVYWGELRADLITGSSSASSNVMNIVRGEITPENSIVGWSEFYTTISYCNKLIDKSRLVRDIDMSFTDLLYRQYRAEAIAIRSLMYFYLVRSFSDVPFVTVSSDTDQQDYYYDKTPGAAIMDSLTLHLERELPNFSVNLGNNDANKGRMTRWAVLSLLADIHLWKGNYQRTIEYCNQIIESGQFSLIMPNEGDFERIEILDPITYEVIAEPSVASTVYIDRLFDELYVEGNSVEGIFEFQFPRTHETLGDPFYSLFRGTTTVSPLIPNEENLMENIFPPFEYANIDGRPRDVRGSGFAYKGGYIWKWVGTSASGNTLRTQRNFPKWIVYRYADILLMKAEALNQSGRDDQEKLKESYELVQQIRYRANAVDTEQVYISESDHYDASALEQLILAERAREFVGEGKRWYDVLRFSLRTFQQGSSSHYLQTLAVVSTPPEKIASLQEKYRHFWFLYWPIDVKTVEIMKLEQNPFYLR